MPADGLSKRLGYPDTRVNGACDGDGVGELLGAFGRLVTPPENVDPICWLESHRWLSVESSAEPGPFKFERIAYAIEPQRAVLDPDLPEVVLCLAAQTAKTEIATLNPLLYWSAVAPGPALVVCPDWKSATSLSCDRIDPMLRDSRIEGLSFEDDQQGGPGSDNSMFRKRIGAMGVTIVNAASASALAQRPVRYLIFEEVSRLPLEARGRGVEGDVVSLARVRTSTFGKDAKIIYSSSPIELELCRVSALYQASSKERYFSRCPRGHYQVLLLGEMNFKTAGCKCLRCSKEYSQQDWQERPGRWIAEAPLNRLRRGFQMPIWPSPFVEWPQVYSEWQDALALKKQGDWSLYRSVCGTRLAEPMKRDKETGATTTTARVLMDRREVFSEKLPDHVKIIVAAVDTQDSWIEYLVLAFGPDRESWALETGQIYGRLNLSREVMYAELQERVLDRRWEREDGQLMRVYRLLQDAGGHLSPVVCRSLKPWWPRCMPYRAVSIPELYKLGEEKSDERTKIMLGNSSLVKDTVNGILGIDKPGPGYCHFPINTDGSDANGFGAEFFAQLAESEIKQLAVDRGLRHWRWKQVLERNEALDLYVMALVALESLRVNLNAMPPDVVRSKPQEAVSAAAAGLEKGGRRFDGTSRLQKPRTNWWRR